MRLQFLDPFARQAIAVAREQTIAVAYASHQIITGDWSELPDSSEDIWGMSRSAVCDAASTTATRCEYHQPNDQQESLGYVINDVGDDSTNDNVHDALFSRRPSVCEAVQTALGSVASRRHRRMTVILAAVPAH